MTEYKYINYNDFGGTNTNPNFQLLQHYNQPYHELAISKPVHPRQNQQAGNVLFIADLPDETCEEDLLGLFKDYNYKVGRVTNGPNRTFALAHFNSVEWAEKARNDLNGIKLTAKYATIKIPKPIRLCRWETKISINERKEDDYKKNLLVKNLHKDISAHYFWNYFKVYGDIRSCKLSIDFAGNSKGFGYVTYYNLTDAEAARKALNGKELNGKPLSIEFLQPGIKKNTKKNNVYVKHIPKENFSNNDLEKIFVHYGELLSVLVAPDRDNPQLNRGFGFVCFKNVDQAEKAQKDLNGKKIWDNVPSLYVNFAMKKEERLEHLQRKKEELKKNSSRMTIFCKIKEGYMFNNESDFNNEIIKCLHMCFGQSYLPKSLKARLDTRTAFITLESINDVEVFTSFYNQNLKQSQDIILYFNPYKSKIERINASSLMKKKYNDFNNNNNINNINIHQVEQKPHNFKNYNDFGQMNMMMMSSMAQGNPGMLQEQFLNNPHMMQFLMQQQQLNLQNNDKFKVYNNFDDVNVNPMTSNNMTNLGFGQINNTNPMFSIPQQTQSNIVENPVKNKLNTKIKNNEENEEDMKAELLDTIYEYVDSLYSEDAPKITGMIGELNLNELRDLLNNKSKLEGVVKSAYHQLHN